MLGHSIIPLQQNNVSVLFSREDVVKSVFTQPFFFITFHSVSVA